MSCFVLGEFSARLSANSALGGRLGSDFGMPSGDFGVPNRPKRRLGKEKKTGSFFLRLFFGQSSVDCNLLEPKMGVSIGSFVSTEAPKSEKSRSPRAGPAESAGRLGNL